MASRRIAHRTAHIKLHSAAGTLPALSGKAPAVTAPVAGKYQGGVLVSH